MAMNIIDISNQARSARRDRPMDAVKGVVVHHTAGDSVESAMQALNNRRLGAQYIIDRDGTIYKSFPDGLAAVHMREAGSKYRTDAGKLSAEFGNRNLIGIEVVGMDDSDIRPAQVEATKLLTQQLSTQYGFPLTNVWGHGELQSNKQSTEGATIVAAIRGEPPPPPGEGRYAHDPFGVAASKQPQDAQSAIASLIAPSGGAAVPDMPTAAMGYAPNLSGIEPPAPPMPQVASNPDPLPTPPPQWVNGTFAQDTMAGGTSPPMPRLRDQSVLDQQRADMLDEMLFGAGPHRGEFARGRPEGRWTGGGAPDASAVPMPTLSPLNPAVGGPADRRPTPPMPTLRPEGRWMSGAGGAPDAGSVPNPPPRGTPYAPGFPDVFGEQPQRVLADAPARFDMEAPAAMPEAAAAPRLPADGLASEPGKMTETERARIYANLEQFRRADAAGPPIGASLQDARTKDDIAPPPPNPYDDWTRQYDTPGPITMANERMGVFEGTPDPSTIAPPSRTPEVGNINYTGPLPTQRLPQTQAAVSEPGMGLGPYGMTPPPMPLADARTKDDAYSPPAYVPDFNFAPMPSPFGPQAGAMTGEGAPSSGVWSQPGSGQWMTDDRPKSAPLPSMADQFNLSFSPGGPGVIMDLPGRPSSPMPVPDLPFGAPSAFAGPQGDGDIYDGGPRASYAAELRGSMPAGDFWSAPPYTVPPPNGIDPGRFTDAFPQKPLSAIQASVVQPAPQTPPPPADAEQIAPYVDNGPVQQTAAPAPLPEPAPAPTQAARQPQRGAGGFIGRALGGLLGGIPGAVGGGLLGGGGGGGFGFGQPATFAWSGGGSAPYGNNGGSTTYQKGTTNALGRDMYGNPANALSWQGSKGQTVTVVQDPWTGTYMSSF